MARRRVSQALCESMRRFRGATSGVTGPLCHMRRHDSGTLVPRTTLERVSRTGDVGLRLD